MRILFVQCPTSHMGAKEKVYPLGLARLCALVPDIHEKRGVDLNLHADPWPVLRRQLENFRPHVTAISFRNIDPLAGQQSSYLPALQTTVAMVRRVVPKTRIIVGGPAFSMFARRIMEEIADIDLGLVGEGETVFAQLIDLDVSPDGIGGVIYRSNGRIHQNPTTKAVDLDRLPLPDTRTFDPAAYGDGNAYVAAMGIEGKRGCDLACGYCLYPFLGGRRFRTRPPERIVDEMETMKKEHGIDLFHFTDPVVNRPLDHFRRLCEVLIRRRLNISWTGFFREDALDGRTTALAKEAGLVAIYFSADALTDHGLKMLSKRLTFDDVLAAARITAKHDILTVQHFLVNLPGEESPAHFHAALDNLNRLLDAHHGPANLGAVVFNTLRLYPQAPLTRRLIREKRVDPTLDLLYPVYYDPPATSHFRHRLEGVCQQALALSRVS